MNITELSTVENEKISMKNKLPKNKKTGKVFNLIMFLAVR